MKKILLKWYQPTMVIIMTLLLGYLTYSQVVLNSKLNEIESRLPTHISYSPIQHQNNINCKNTYEVCYDIYTKDGSISQRLEFMRGQLDDISKKLYQGQ